MLCILLPLPVQWTSFLPHENCEIHSIFKSVRLVQVGSDLFSRKQISSEKDTPFQIMFHLPRLNESSPSVANELVDMQNISHIQELYQNLPQLQKAAHSPFDTFQANPMEYSHPYEQPMRHVRMPAVYNRPQFHQHRHEPPLNNDRMIYKRQG